MANPVARGWAVQRADGSVTAEFGPHVTEADVWWVICGDADDDIAWEKDHGARAFRCLLVGDDGEEGTPT